jgi:hypothetical protein
LLFLLCLKPITCTHYKVHVDWWLHPLFRSRTIQKNRRNTIG